MTSPSAGEESGERHRPSGSKEAGAKRKVNLSRRGRRMRCKVGKKNQPEPHQHKNKNKPKKKKKKKNPPETQKPRSDQSYLGD